MKRPNMIMGSLLASAFAAACTAEVPTVDQTGPGPGQQACINGYCPPPPPPPMPCPPGTVCPTAYPAGYCNLDTRQVVQAQGRFIEIVTSRGALFEFENG